MQATSASRSATAKTSEAPPIDSENSTNTIDFADNLPLRLIQSETIPPAPTRSESAIDWLPDFAGYSWIAYGASSLLVISHFPSPLSEEETSIGPIFRQVFELSTHSSASVSSVHWSPSVPSSGDLAVALDNCVGLFSHNSSVSDGSFPWSQTAVLLHSMKVETIKWTGSGDGIISVGVEVILWRNKSRSWEIAWKFKTELPQILVSASFSIEGPLATAPLNTHSEESSSPASEASRCVSVGCGDGKSNYTKAELCHPMPVCMIQWRPLMGRQSNLDARHSMRHVLLTCCLDGTVRLWSEIIDGRVGRIGKDIHDQKTTRRSFHVVALIEINQTMDGTLGSDIFVRWATEIDGMITAGKTTNQYFSCGGRYKHDKTGRCEWLVAFGPNMLVTFWVIQCLDDVAPMRCPRVTLWKRQELRGTKLETSGLLLNKVVTSRNELSGPPNICSLVQLLPCNSLGWSQIYTQISTNVEEGPLHNSGKENVMSCYAGGHLNIDGHTGKILQVAVQPFRFETELAASLDTDGLILFWSLSTISNCFTGLPTLNPAWKLSGKFVTATKYSSLSWAPSVLDEDSLLLMGHDQGIDCVMVKIFKNEEEKMLCQNLCTIPFTSHYHGNGPTKIYSIPFSPSTCKKTISNFLLLAIWKEDFQVLSWKITIHSNDSDKSFCACNLDNRKAIGSSSWVFDSNFSGKRYCTAVDPCSSLFPDPHNKDEVTSFAVVCPSICVLSEEQNWTPVDELCCNYSTYHIATGCSNGSLKLWRSMLATQLNSNLQWELVGMLAAHQGPITSISLADCGQKIATLCSTGPSNYSSTVHIWESVHLAAAGSFLLEDTLFLDGQVIAFNWLTMGSGQLLLGVCLQNEMRVYAERRNDGAQPLMKPGKSLAGNIWVCIAFGQTYPDIRDFLWGPRATGVVVHDGYFSVFSQWSFLVDKKYQAKCNSGISKNNFLHCKGGSSKDMLGSIFIAQDICESKESSAKENCKARSPLLMKMNIKNDIMSRMFEASAQQNLDTKIDFCSVQDVAEKIGGSLPFYHPEALLMNIYTGHWKRAYVVLRHLVEYLTSTDASQKGYFSAKSSSHVIPLVHLSNYLEGVLPTRLSEKTFLWNEDASLITPSLQVPKGANQLSYSWGCDSSNNNINSSSIESELSVCVEAVEKLYRLTAISNTEKMQILAIVDLLREVRDPLSASAYESLDEPGRRFWVAVRFQQLCFTQRFGRSASVGEWCVDSGLFAWAFHSDWQENLFSSLLPNEPSWQEMRNMGVGFWYTNGAQLRLKMERLARQQYLKSKDPKACALLYVALNRLQVLAGLFKISKDDKDKPLVGFLARNFQEDKNKAAALKNAYVLMGRHQLELAVAFFLLGGDTSSAVTVCAKNLGDEQLALVICRLVEGYGGPLERQLILKFLLPSAVEKGNSWLASFLEWVLGNYAQSFLSMLGTQKDSPINNSAPLSNRTAFLDPSVGQYCLMLATQNKMKNAVGERDAAVMGRWAILMSATAFNRCGLPMEALECLSSSLSMPGGSDQGSMSETGKPEVLKKLLKPSPYSSSCNWISGDVACHMETHAKLDLAMQYISKLLREHPSCLDTNMAPMEAFECSEYKIRQYKPLLENFQHKLMAGLAYFEQKFSLIPRHLINMIVISQANTGLPFIGYHILHVYTSQYSSQEKRAAFDSFVLYPTESRLLLKATEEMSCLFSRYIVACFIACYQPKSCPTNSNAAGENRLCFSAAWQFYMQGLIWSLWRMRAILKLFSGSCDEDFVRVSSIILDLSEYCIYFASAWLQRNYKALILIVKPLLLTCSGGHAPYGIIMKDLKKLLHQTEELLAHNTLIDNTRIARFTKATQHDQGEAMIPSIPEDSRWQIIRAALWGHVSAFLKHQLNSLSEKHEDNYSFGSFYRLSSSMSNPGISEPDDNCLHKQLELVSMVLAKLLKTTYVQSYSSCTKQFASFLLEKMENGSNEPTFTWLEGLSESHPRTLNKHLSQDVDSQDMMNIENDLSASEILWDIFVDPKVICEGLEQGNLKWKQYIKPKPSKEWSDIFMGPTGECKADESCKQEGRLGSSFTGSKTGSPLRGPSPDSHSSQSCGRPNAMLTENSMPFQNPKEVYKRTGELLEALCINSIDQKQVALASNKKGIIYFKLEDGLHHRDYSKYIWAEADWPPNGWAGSESTPVPTCVSPGIGLGSKQGAHLGLGGATIGLRSLARPGKDLTGGGAFGIPGYAGMGASGLGWGIQENFEEFVDLPATVENINTRAFSSHPSRPFFLVGSSNTHVYLWEFGKDKATATYGVLPAANVPPPYALASISAVQFDHCGHRFATAALDGTVCTWQLEVGGRSNVFPTESSLCFNSHALDVTYVTASGSIIAVAGYSSNGVNVVIWDTLAPPSTSRASIMCHEGGACSLSVFDNDIGSGSVSPFILTGGKGGDVGLHDFRYIATGRTKRHRQFASGEPDANASLIPDMHNRTGDQNRDGMLWYIPKAHLGSVTKISTIPNSSLFLTGSKDGDVKLWDAKATKLVFHWPKLHERHTFLQPSSRSFGGVVRVAVTDIQVMSHGFLTCGGDGCVKLVQLKGLL
ncbi:DmX-like protein [Actinidia chinensis var. chinensis]|uniref:DmX-like protein n=1 Tax=Actinidia chinensis var. chinensis TaxID=1590841 RepID=A0A2R6Q7P5_ACTCC|nr:DmX-like protein [Actinidia chinensis var. chinensis]